MKCLSHTYIVQMYRPAVKTQAFAKNCLILLKIVYSSGAKKITWAHLNPKRHLLLWKCLIYPSFPVENKPSNRQQESEIKKDVQLFNAFCSDRLHLHLHTHYFSKNLRLGAKNLIWWQKMLVCLLGKLKSALQWT